MGRRHRHPIAHLLRHLSTLMLRRAGVVVTVSLVLAALMVWPIAARLGVNTDNSKMISEDRDWKRAESEMAREFPRSHDTILAVVDAGTPSIAADVRDRIMTSLESQTDRISAMEAPDADPYVARQGLLMLDAERLRVLASSLDRAGPALASLHRNQSVSGFVGLLSGVLAAPDRAEGLDAPGLVREVAAAADAAIEGHTHELDWSSILPSPGGGDQARRLILATPVLERVDGFPAERAMEAIRRAAAEVKTDDDRGFRVRLTGGAAMDTDELKSAASGAGTATALALGGVLIALYFGLASFRLVAAAMITLVAGLLGTAAFAALAVGKLNLVSVAFAVLYVGLGIDYAIHVCLRYREAAVRGASHARATLVALRETAPSLGICALTTSVGFFAFTPTAFRGVAELGLIAGVGMFISLLASLTLLPALIFAFGRPVRYKAVGDRSEVISRLIETPQRWRRAIVVGALLCAVAAAVLAPRAYFDRNRMNLQDPNVESVATFRELMATSQNPPMTLSVLADTPEEAARLSSELSALPSVRRVVSVDTFVPADQDEKLAIIERLRARLAPGLGGSVQRTPALADEVAALDALRDSLASLEGDSGALPSAAMEGRAAIAELLDVVHAEDQAEAADAITRFRASLFAGLAPVLDALRESLEAGPVTIDTLPDRIRREWVAPDGRRRIEIIPSGDLGNDAELVRFVGDVLSVAPRAVGPPAGTLRAGDTISTAFAQALGLAVLAVAIIVAVMLHRVTDTVYVLAPLALAGGLTAMASVTLDVPFNFANVIALPLMLGVGVDSGIHMVHRWRTLRPGERLLSSSTTRGVLFSSLTTIFSFGTLALSTHRGMHSMGTLLTISMSIVLVCTLVVLPAILPASGAGAQRR